MSDDHDRGLQHDLQKMMAAQVSRRRVFRLLGGAAIAGLAVIPVLGCTNDSSGDDDVDVDAGTGTDGTTGGTCSAIPEETAGPYPGDGSNGANILTVSGVVRSDIRTSIGSASATAAGVPLTITLTLVDTSADCAPLVGYAIYLWHCDRAGNYSMYSSAVVNENYLRGVQVTDANGQVTFTSIFPACYSGRWPHIHFEVYPSVSSTSSSGNKVATSQLALPETVCETVYATTGYSASVNNLNQVSLSSDNVFSDDSAAQQLATVTGSVAAGYAATLTVAI